MTVAQMAERLQLDSGAIEAALLRLETQGQVLHGRLLPVRRPTSSGATAACSRASIGLTVGRLRREIEPVTAAQYMAFLQRWQHVAPASRLHGIDGTLQIVRQLEGYEIPTVAWEGQVLPARVAGYKPEYLDRLCYSGDVMWGRLSPHPALEPREVANSRRVRPTRLAPIALFLRANAEELIVRGAATRRGALARRARDSRDGRRTARAVLCRDRSRDQTPAQRSRGGALAARRRRIGHRRRLRRAALAQRRETAARRTGIARAAAIFERALDALAGGDAKALTPKALLAGCSRAGASSSATSSPANRSRRDGASC